jgi:hypothetical protein
MKQAYSFGLYRQEISLGSNNYLYGFINKKGQWVIEPQFTYVSNGFDKFGYSIAKKGDLYGFINPRGEWLINPVFDGIGMGFGANNCCTASINKQWGMIDRMGNWLFEPKFQMLGMGIDKKGFCPAQLNDKWGFINKDGLWIIPPTFDSMYCEPTGIRISSFRDGNTCIIQLNNHSYRINRRGNLTSLLSHSEVFPTTYFPVSS